MRGGQHVIHAYGAGGRGVEMSLGVADDVVDLVQRSRKSKPTRSML
jgi:hypothetical protein